MAVRLNKTQLISATRLLCQKDKHLNNVVAQYGSPPLWTRKAGFASLVLIILEQQVSLASARASYNRLQAFMGEVTAARVAVLHDSELRALGFTRQKASYCIGLAQQIVSGELNLRSLARGDDETVRDTLCRVRGIGRWTADIYLLMVLRRPDIWPQGDIALASAVKSIKHLREKPDHDQQNSIAENWRPWRSVAARIAWHYYLSERNK